MPNAQLRTSALLRTCLHSQPVLAVLLVLSPFAPAQRTSAGDTAGPQIVRAIDDNDRVKLEGGTHPLARAEFDRGPAEDSLPMDRMLLVLKRTPAQEAAIRALIEEMSEPNSPRYHQWLTPQQFGERFGAAQQDIDAVEGWLGRHGFRVNRVANSRTAIEFSGSAGQVREAFHTAIHAYEVNGERHYANASDPQIPASMAPAVAGVVSMNNFVSRPALHAGRGRAVRAGEKGSAPAFDFYDENGNLLHGLTPADTHTVYHETPLLSGANKLDGTGQTVAIAARSDIATYDYDQYRSFFEPFYSSNNLHVIVDGFDPGYLGNSDTMESTFDVEMVASTAPNANIDLVVSGSTYAGDGIAYSASYIVDNNLASIVTVSYMECEANLGTAGNTFWNNVWEQAAAQGISAFVISGDDGPAMCDGDPFATNNAGEPAVPSHGKAVNGLASSPYNLAVGGTSFYEGANAAEYWSPNTTLLEGSALSTIPEQAWNESCSPAVCGPAAATFMSSSGGPSSCTVSTVNSKGQPVCSGFYAKPWWQTGIGVPADGARDLPDIALNSAMHDPFIFCFNYYCYAEPLGDFGFYYGFGTSVASPALAGVMALIQEKEGEPQGNPAPEVYRLANTQAASLPVCNASLGAGAACVFRDVTQGNTNVPCVGGSPGCSSTNPKGYGSLTGYSAGIGYDETTGWGSVDIANLVNEWGTTATATGTALSFTPSKLVHGQAATIDVTVTPKTGTGKPTGQVALLTNSQDANAIGLGAVTLANGAYSGSLRNLPGGKYQLSARYGGDMTYAPSESAGKTITVTPEPSEITLKTYDGNGNPFAKVPTTMPYGSALNQVYFVAGKSGLGIPTGLLTSALEYPPSAILYKAQQELNVAGTAAFYEFFYDPPGQVYSFSTSYAGDASFDASTLPRFSVTVVKAAPALALTCSQSMITLVGRVNCSVQATTESEGDYLTGAMTLYNGASLIATAPLNNFYNLNTFVIGATAEFSVPGDALNSGANSLTAVYAGDTNYTSAKSPAVKVTVTGPGTLPGAATTTTLSGATSPATASQVLTLTASVKTAAAQPVSGGTVTFFNGKSVLGAVQVVGDNPATGFTSGTAVLATRLPVGSDSITARYSGVGSTYQPSVSAASAVAVTGGTNTFTQIAVNEDAKNIANFDFTAIVSALGHASPAGQVAFSDTTSTTALGSGTLAPAPVPFGSVQTANAAIDSYFEADGLSVAIADVNHDGYPDIVTADEYLNTISLFLGKGDGTFQTAAPYTIGNSSTALELGNVLLVDLNADGNLDIVTSDDLGNVWVLLGNGDGTFGTAVSYAAGTSGQQMVTADFNNDGIPDIAIASENSSSVVVLLGKGDGTFEAPVSTAVASAAYGLVAADVNLDGVTDLIAYGQHGMQLLTGKGDGTFTAAATEFGPTIDGYTYAVNAAVAADLNGDGVPDLAVTAQYGGGAVMVMLGNGDGTFRAPLIYPGNFVRGLGVQTLATADINGDGIPDLVTAGSVNFTSDYSVFLGTGDGTFNPTPVTYSVDTDGTENFPNAFALADLNGDGVPDAVAVFTGSDTSNGVVVELGTANAAASISNIALPGTAAQQITGQYMPGTGASYNTSTSPPISVNPQLSAPVLMLSATHSSIYFGAVAQLYLKVQAGSGYTGTSYPTGSMTLTEIFPNGSSATYGPYSLYAGTGYSYVYLDYNYGLGGAGVFSFSACYSGDGNFESGCTKSTVTIDNQTDTSATTLTGPANVIAGDELWVSVAATTPTNTSAYAYGAVTFFDGKTQLGTPVYLETGAPPSQVPLTGLTPGTHVLTAQFAGEPATYKLADILPSTSAPLTVHVDTPKAHSGSIGLTVTPASPAAGQVVTLAAAVTLNGAAPQTTGSVTFLDGTASLGTVHLSGKSPAKGFVAGTAVLKRSLSIGAHTITASYARNAAVSSGGVTVNDPLVSAAATVEVKPSESTSTSLTAAADAINSANSDYAATVFGHGFPPPGGTLTFKDTTASKVLGQVTLSPANAAPGFAPAQDVPLTGSPGPVATGDLRGNGLTDLVVADSAAGSVYVLLGKGNGSFAAQQSYTLTAPATAIAVGDVNADGVPDIVVITSDTHTEVLLGNGDGTFKPEVGYLAVIGGQQIVLADLNGDGAVDIVEAGNDALFLVVLFGKGDGTFPSTANIGLTGGPGDSIAVADFNGDGALDIAYETGSEVYVLYGVGDGTFGGAQYVDIEPGALTAADVNGDGLPDLITAGSGVTVAINDGNGGFTIPRNYGYSAVSIGGSAFVADLNGDGIPDILANGRVLVGVGDGTFLPAISYNGQFEAVGDFNNDGVPDIVSFVSPNLTLEPGGAALSAQLTDQPVSGTGLHSVVATYTPAKGAPYTGSTSPAVQVNAAAAVATSKTTLTPSISKPVFGQAVTIQAQVSGGATAPTGQIVFTVDGVAQPPQTLASSKASLKLAGLAGGAHTIAAFYYGDAHNAPDSSSLGVTVAAAADTIALASSATSVTAGATVTLTAQIGRKVAGTLSGIVTFYDGGKLLGSVNPNASGQAQFITSVLAVGTHNITAAYSSDPDFATITSAAKPVKVNPPPKLAHLDGGA